MSDGTLYICNWSKEISALLIVSVKKIFHLFLLQIDEKVSFMKSNLCCSDRKTEENANNNCSIIKNHFQSLYLF